MEQTLLLMMPGLNWRKVDILPKEVIRRRDDARIEENYKPAHDDMD